VAPGREVGAQVAEVVDLAAERDDGQPIRGHRLLAALDVDDGEPPVAEGGVRAQP
jgi:hypothetical protein